MANFKQPWVFKNGLTSKGPLRAEGTDAMLVPRGTTAQRPTPEDALIRVNSETGLLEFYSGGTWTNGIVDGMSGVPLVSTPAAGVNSTRVATTAFVRNEVKGISSISVGGAVNVTVTPAQAGVGILQLVGVITANIEMRIPTFSGIWLVNNLSTGAFDITVKHSTGTGVVVKQNTAVIIWSDGTNVYSAEISALSILVSKTSSTGSAVVPIGTTGQRDGTPQNGYFRYNSTLHQFEGYTSTGWGTVGGGSTGGGTDKAFFLNDKTITANYTIPTGQNAGSFGPMTIADGVTVTIPDGSTWSIV